MPSAADAGPYRRALLTKDCLDALRRGDDRHPKQPSAAGAATATDPAAECARRVEAGEPTGGLLSSVATADDYVPKDQPEKLALIADIRKRLADPTVELLSPESREEIKSFTPPDDLRSPFS